MSSYSLMQAHVSMFNVQFSVLMNPTVSRLFEKVHKAEDIPPIRIQSAADPSTISTYLHHICDLGQSGANGTIVLSKD